ncbi:hypothetical protein KX729_14625 [Rhizobium sp. XQZ8]|uniref:hypothetical protein n=1 Tax=Rhizobium populisoli TaxID=2859785 RepID=UPI001CA476D4|nr:hypothetical protein [Rhizobium populisoli]MBW6422689.1 hypothetical protein [Rhizobium populisoli]
MTFMSADATAAVRPLFLLPVLTIRLLWRFWPQLMALWTLGIIGNSLINQFAVMIGHLNPLAGLSSLALIVLLKLVIIVALFQTVRPGLPSLDAASRLAEHSGRSDSSKSDEAEPTAPKFTSILALTLVPFFVYYAAWGFLGDTIREYSQLSLDLMMFGEAVNPLEFGGGAWLFVSVVIAWIVRRFAKAMHKRSKAAIWPIVIVVCEANWAFIGLYVISDWQDEIRAWVAHLPETLGLFFGLIDPVSNAAAATVLPPMAEQLPTTLWDDAQKVFFYALYPVVWLTLAALVYGYDINGERPLVGGRLSRAVSRWEALPKSLRDFISHFISGTAKRYRALAEGVGLALGSGIVLTVAAIVLYRLLGWGTAWTWFYLAQWIGPHERSLWQLIFQGIGLLLGDPSAPGDGVLTMPIRICLLAATLEIGFAQGREWRRSG